MSTAIIAALILSFIAASAIAAYVLVYCEKGCVFVGGSRDTL